MNLYELVMNQLPYLDCFVREVLRFHPIAVQAVHRQCVESTQIGRYRIDKGPLCAHVDDTNTNQFD
jgi:cytochrome P450